MAPATATRGLQAARPSTGGWLCGAIVVLSAAAWATGSACLPCPAAEGLPPLCPAPRPILVDAVHANDLSPYGLRPGEHDYHHLHGYHRALEYLRNRGVPLEFHRQGRLDASRLASCGLLFINLVSAERPPFLVGEIEATGQFVAQGGSLLVITDHTNVYYHTYRLMPLFEQLGLESFTDAACDAPPWTLAAGSGWIAVERLAQHPVTSGLECIALQTGGCVDPRWAVAWNSPPSWDDACTNPRFGENAVPGFCGNFRRDPGERSGPLGVVLARTFGRGRIVVAGDQNMFGDVFLCYADNYRLWLQAVAWLLDTPALAQSEPFRQWKSPRVLLYEDYRRAAWGADDGSGCHFAFVLLGRHYWTFANSRLEEPSDLIVFADNDRPLPQRPLQAALAHLRSGKNVLILNAEHSPGDDSVLLGQMLAALGLTYPAGRARQGLLTLSVAGGGTIGVLGIDTPIDNTTIARPEQPPDPQQAARQDLLLDAVRRLLPRRTRP